MAGSDPNSPMQAPRTTRDVMKAAPPVSAPDDDAPTAPATDKATDAVQTDQADA